ncbi:MAG: bifunctional pyr operon transcriptional regulator/uracil phosphoribosyltransferase PyrR [Deltaproteobacteria bacterium]|nr:MAG: bifunctional pyr operon transcriptional regulator/uracil phosphoribosyltransferase PyrR [Deltaproteobacteria bacterium]
MEKKVILEEKQIAGKLREMAEQIINNNGSLEDLVLVGIRTGGAFLATRLRNVIREKKGFDVPLGILDITLYRDDWTRIGPAPSVGKTKLPFSIDDKAIVLVDDVIFTGRTVRAAMDALMDFGRPKKIELAILVDRGDGHRELPITANYSGGIWETAPGQTINVYLKEAGFPDHVAIEQKKAA